ncbi:hypothetical protein VNI00_005700 [Paramarasmius palmivorus]|uniref:Uncharacterized protein n=1 Tax=Paramarasmius palmivorus TaxID=297713 RepID=A0AAW0DDE4_9AGAR
MLRRTATLPFRRSYTTSTGNSEKPRTASPHAQWYRDIVPAMIPIFLLGSAVYLGLQLWQTRLSHEKYIHQARERVEQLEAQVQALTQQGDQPVSDGNASESVKQGSWWNWRR